MSKLLLHKKFICTDSSYGTAGHNKFWNIKVFEDGTLETEYGRVGDPGVLTPKKYSSGYSALREAEKLIQKKKKGKKKKDGSGRDSQYQEVEIVGTGDVNHSSKQLPKVSLSTIAHGDSDAESLLVLLDKENIHNITSGTTLKYDQMTGLFSTPLGVVGKSSIDKARDVLSKMQPLVQKKQFNKKGDKLAEEFMMLIPQNIGRRRPTLENLCPSIEKLEDHNSILDSLQASLDIVNSSNDSQKKDDPVHDFGVTLQLLNDDKEFDRINTFFQKTKRTQHVCHHLKMQKIYRVNHKEMKREFLDHGKVLGNVKELWHGTRVGNILSILTKGIYIPPSSAAHCTGRLYGNGVYFSDQSTKSLNYSYGYWSGNRNNHCFMFLFDVAMGKSFTPKSKYGNSYPVKGYDSTFAEAGVSGVINNEMIIYHIYQCCPKYLIEFN